MALNKKFLSLAVTSLFAFTATVGLNSQQAAMAANNPLSTVTAVEIVNGQRVQYFDLTLNVDWDYDNASDPKRIQLGTGANRGGGDSEGARAAVVLDRAYVTNLVNQTARTLFVMTNGQHRLRNVYVFKNGKFGQNVDIRVLNVPGRANASAPGWLSDGGLTTNNYITNCNAENQPDGECAGDDLMVLDPENFVQTGEVIAHELGHYLYALFDEYVDGKDCDAQNPASPCKDDIARPTAMNNQAAAYRISTTGDYPQNDFAKTAHGRAYGESAWQTLVKSPEQDSDTAKEAHGNRRIRFEAFNGVPVPAIGDLKNFTDMANNRDDRLNRQTGDGAEVATFAGYDTRLKLIFEGDAMQPAQPRNVLVIDRTLPTATFAEAITAAKGLADRAPSNTRFAIVTVPTQTNGNLGFTNNMEAANKQAIKAGLDGLTRVNGTPDLQAAYNQAKIFVTGARPTEGNTENAANTDTLTLLTLNTTTVPSTLGTTARGDKIAFNVLGFKAPAAMAAAAPAPAQNLQTLATATGGSNNTVKSANEAIKEGNAALMDAMGASEALVTADLSDDPFVASQRLSTTFTVNNAVDGDVVVRWYYNTEDDSKLSFTCADGSEVTKSDLSNEERLATCTIKTDGSKTVTAQTNANADAVEVEVVSTPQGAAVELSAMIDGGTVASGRPPVLMAKLAGSTPITGATIKVLVFNADSESETPAIPEITLNAQNDNGTNGDNRANDGIYTLNLAGRLPAGNYVVVAEATTDANSRFSSQGVINAAGVTPGTKLVGAPIQRQSEGEFTLDSGAPGVSTTARASNGGGGCTVGNGSDGGLLVLLSLAVLGLIGRGFKALRGRSAR
jgi:hypothetical protein